MLYEPSRHETLRPIRWDENAVRRTIERIVADTEARFSADRYWPIHPLDAQDAAPAGQFETSLYDGACGVFWALHYLEAVGACRAVAALRRRSSSDFSSTIAARSARALPNTDRRRFSGRYADRDDGVWLSADRRPRRRPLADLIAGNIDHPARELMLGAPGTLLAALYLLRAHWKRELGGALPAHREQALAPARVVAASIAARIGRNACTAGSDLPRRRSRVRRARRCR